jgi:hypothetical protein
MAMLNNQRVTMKKNEKKHNLATLDLAQFSR